MIEAKLIEEKAKRLQTTADHVAREYFQHVFLETLSRQKNAERILLKGGAGLRFIWKSPRFSEHLNFTGMGVMFRTIELLIANVLAEVKRLRIDPVIMEVKKTPDHYSAALVFRGSGYQSRIPIEISLSEPDLAYPVFSFIVSDLIPPYSLAHLPERELVAEKVDVLFGGAKALDFYDFYFILTSRLECREISERKPVTKFRLINQVKSYKGDFRKELKPFLPASQHPLLKDFKSVLVTEIERHWDESL